MRHRYWFGILFFWLFLVGDCMTAPFWMAPEVSDYFAAVGMWLEEAFPDQAGWWVLILNLVAYGAIGFAVGFLIGKRLDRRDARRAHARWIEKS